jgi:hypothetical protein
VNVSINDLRGKEKRKVAWGDVLVGNLEFNEGNIWTANQEVRGNSVASQMRSVIQRSTPAISTLLTSTLALIIHVFNSASSELDFFFGGILYRP